MQSAAHSRSGRGRNDRLARWRLVMQSQAYVAEKSPLTNRIRRHFARIKAVRTIAADHGYRAEAWLKRPEKALRDVQSAVRRLVQETSGP